MSDPGRLALKSQIIVELEEENARLLRRVRTLEADLAELKQKYEFSKSDLSLTEISRIS